MNNVKIIIAISCLLAAAAFVGCDSMYDNTSVAAGKSYSFFTAIQIDPPEEDSAGPQFAAVGDLNNDGLMDIVSAWNQSQPVQIHIQQRAQNGDIQFVTLPVGGTTPIAIASGLEVADMDQDGWLDIVVLVKDTGLVATCDESREDCDVTENGGILENALDGMIVMLMNPQDPINRPWVPVGLVNSNLAGIEEGELPDEGGYTDIDIADINTDGLPDIITAFNSAEGEPQFNSIDFYANPGGAAARSEQNWIRSMIYFDLPIVKSCRIEDIDGDGYNDVIATYPSAKSMNIRWIRNPLGYQEPGEVTAQWEIVAPIGQVDTHADSIDLGDVDLDGLTDVVVRSNLGLVVQWFKRPSSPSQTFIRNPWQVYSLAEFSTREPNAMALGDLNRDGLPDLVVSAEGAMAMFSPSNEDAVLQHWSENIIVDDTPPQELADAQATTLINSLVTADIDGDGWDDIIATFDRAALSGLSNDALMWFRNTTGD